MTSRLAVDFTAPSKLSAKTRPIMRLQQLFPLTILPWHIGLVLQLTLEKYEMITDAHDIYLYLLCENI